MKSEEWRDVDPTVRRKKNHPGRRAFPRFSRLVQSWPAAQAGRTSAADLTEYLRTFYAGQPAPLRGCAEITAILYNATLDGFQFPIPPCAAHGPV